MDEGRWIIGDLSLLVAKEYGTNSIDRFAKDINVEVTRVREYRTVCKRFNVQHRQKLLSEFPTLSYSHFRTALKLKSLEAATAFLEECGTKAYTVEQARVKVKGGGTPLKLLDAEGTLAEVDVKTGKLVLCIASGADFGKLIDQFEKRENVRVQIHALEPESEPQHADAT
jgi:hypothetical protein